MLQLERAGAGSEFAFHFEDVSLEDRVANILKYKLFLDRVENYSGSKQQHVTY